MKKIFLSMLSSVLLAACGGGSGGKSGEPAAIDPVQAASAAAPVESSEDEASVMTPPDDDPVAELAEETEGAGGAAASDFELAGYVPAPGPGDAPHAAAVLAQAAPAAAAATLYVSPKGKDANPGTASEPFRSIARAAKAARPGTRVLVAPGTYSGGFRTTASGSAGAGISYVSSVKWGARIVPPANSRNKTAWDNRGSHVDIVGFDIDGSNPQGGTPWSAGIYSSGSYDSIRRNHVHHIAQASRCNGAGGSAIGVDSYHHGVEAAVIANLVHDIGPASCRFVQGIYVSTSGRVSNNVVYRVSAAGIHLWHDARNVTITNNTVTGSNTGIIVGAGNFYHGAQPNDHTAVYNNIVYDNKYGISEQGKTGLNNSYRNNLVFQNASYDFRLKNGLKHTGTVRAAPMFVDDPRGAKPNLKISAGSPAVGKATPDLAESTDFDGRARDARAGYDIGALQH